MDELGFFMLGDFSTGWILDELIDFTGPTDAETFDGKISVTGGLVSLADVPSTNTTLGAFSSFLSFFINRVT